MKKIDVGQTMTILANVGVLFGILLLAYELNQNRQITQSQTRNSIADKLVDLIVQEALDPNLREMNLKREAGEVLTREEEYLFERMEIAFWRYRENVYYQYRIGLYEETEYAGQRQVWLQILNTDEMSRRFWCERQVESRQSPEFVEEINSLLARPCD